MDQKNRRHARPYYREEQMYDAMRFVGGISFICGCMMGAVLTLMIMG